MHRKSDVTALHRDIKSANVVLTLAWEPKLIDCGLSKLLEPGAAASKGTTGTAFGTPGYQCPLYQNGRAYDATSEAYSFGVVLLELLTGRLATSRGCGHLAQHFLETEDPEDDMLPWPLAVALDPTWTVCPLTERGDLCELALACVKGRSVKALERRPSVGAAMQLLLRLERSCAHSATGADAARLAAENAALVAAVESLSAERERDARRYECIGCGETLPLRAGLLCAGKGSAGERHFLCGPLANGCLDGWVAARCGGADRGAPELVHITPVGRVLGLRCAAGDVSCGLFEEAALPAALLPSTYATYRAALVEIERHVAAAEAERAAKTASDVLREEQLRKQAASFEAQLAALRSALAARDEAERRAAERRQAELEAERRALEKAKAEAEAMSAEWIRINTRPCPNCGQPVERIEGCTDMVCGRDYHGNGRGLGGRLLGCGTQFRWTGLALDGTRTAYTRLPQYSLTR